MSEYTNHQFSIFPQDRPKAKVPISAERIREVKALIAAGDKKGSLEKIRELREGLEAFERRISNGKVK